MVRVIWIRLRRPKWTTIVRAERSGPEVSLSPQYGRSNYDIIFLQDFQKVLSLYSKAPELGWRLVVKPRGAGGRQEVQQLSGNTAGKLVN